MKHPYILLTAVILSLWACQQDLSDAIPVYSQWHTLTLSFEGPTTSEKATENPFLQYRLSVIFQHQTTQQIIRGFYAADGKAAETSASAGAIWQVRFTPDKIGKWSYTAQLHHGDSIALSTDLEEGTLVPITQAAGDFIVQPSSKEGNDFRASGRLGVNNGYFQFKESGNYFLKAGTNSPENFLAFEDFDDTYRIKAEAREGEAAAPETIHQYKPHVKDWKIGDPTWKEGKGKAIIGAVNYLASKGMNAIYFLVFNIQGDGKDVWPFISPDDFTRFDVSKLEQWEILFQHMQSKGILLHIVLQETENETLLDNGDTGPIRQLFYRELIARFGHHLALVWNLGEENGPAPWSPVGQNTDQRKAMATFLKKNDPYQHPVVLHTHSYDPIRSDILNDLLGFEALDGLSLQQDKREQADSIVTVWKEQSKASGQEWLITMDEIGMWYTGALTDTADIDHPTLRRHALWGTLLSGGAGVEWYFGAKHPQNDLTSENWRLRDRLWELTHHAKAFFQEYLPYWDMQTDPALIDAQQGYCFRKNKEIFTIYLPETQSCQLDLRDTRATFAVYWYSPLSGGSLQEGSVKSVEGGAWRHLGQPPAMATQETDWVILVREKVGVVLL